MLNESTGAAARRKVMRGILAALAVPCICLAQAPARPRLVVDAVDHDFGTIPTSAVASHRFRLANGGGAPLTIQRVTHACGCTSTVLGKLVLAPGESTELEVSFNPSGLSGMIRKTVQVLSDDPGNPVQTLTFEAALEGDVKASTPDVFFQALGPRERRKASVKLSSSSGQPVHVTAVDMSDAPWLGVATREEGRDLWVDLELGASSLPASKPSGTDTLALHVLDPGASVVQLSVHWDRRALVSAVPGRVAWEGAAGRELAAPVVLSRLGNKPFRILAARTSSPLLRVLDVSNQARSRQTIRVVLSPEAKPGVYDEKVILQLDAAGGPDLEIRVSAVLR